MKIQVKCYAGYKGEETPREIIFGDTSVTVKSIQDCWIGPDHRYFKIIGDDRALYLVRHDSISFEWELIQYKNPDVQDSVTATKF